MDSLLLLLGSVVRFNLPNYTARVIFLKGWGGGGGVYHGRIQSWKIKNVFRYQDSNLHPGAQLQYSLKQTGSQAEGVSPCSRYN